VPRWTLAAQDRGVVAAPRNVGEQERFRVPTPGQRKPPSRWQAVATYNFVSFRRISGAVFEAKIPRPS